MLTSSILIVLLIGVALLYDFMNGFHDSSNVVATIISSRAVSPRVALLMSAVAHFSAPFLFGVAVARTIGHEVVAQEAVTVPVILAAALSAIVWNVITWWLGIPSSSSHALIGGLVGAVAVSFGLQNIQLTGLGKILMALFISPLLGLTAGYVIMKLVLFLVRGASPRVSTLFKRLQWITSLGLALSHGTNDAQKTMGIITMGLVATGYLSRFEVPYWVILMSATAIALGTALGGWRIIRTLGAKFYKVRPIHGFTSQLTSAAVIMGAALLGGPVSTTHVVSSSIIGVGSAERLSKVRWGVAGNIAVAWVVTIPVSALMAALLYHPALWLSAL
jgi:PiT family inorganic phosphate transporter